jgi:hypothetical protein
MEDVKPFMKKAMPFVAFVKEEVGLKGVQALETTMPFDELQLLTASVSEYFSFIRSKQRSWPRTLASTVSPCSVRRTARTRRCDTSFVLMAQVREGCTPGHPFSAFE